MSNDNTFARIASRPSLNRMDRARWDSIIVGTLLHVRIYIPQKTKKRYKEQPKRIVKKNIQKEYSKKKNNPKKEHPSIRSQFKLLMSELPICFVCEEPVMNGSSQAHSRCMKMISLVKELSTPSDSNDAAVSGSDVHIHVNIDPSMLQKRHAVDLSEDEFEESEDIHDESDRSVENDSEHSSDDDFIDEDFDIRSPEERRIENALKSVDDEICKLANLRSLLESVNHCIAKK